MLNKRGIAGIQKYFNSQVRPPDEPIAVNMDAVKLYAGIVRFVDVPFARFVCGSPARTVKFVRESFISLLSLEKSIGVAGVMFIPKKLFRRLANVCVAGCRSTNREKGKRNIKSSDYSKKKYSLALGETEMVVKLAIQSVSILSMRAS